MPTIALSGNTIGCTLGIGSYGGLGNSFVQAKKSSNSLKKSLGTLKQKIDLAAQSVKIETAQEAGKKAETRENTKKSSLTLAYEKLEAFISDVGVVDEKVTDKINQRKDDFYTKYNYLKPDSEKSFKERAKDFGKNILDGLCNIGNAIADFVIDVGEWCAEHWKEIVATLVIVAGAIVAVVAVISTGGLALVPLLASIITGAGTLFGITIAASTAVTIATVLSLTVAIIAVGSTVASSVMNVIDVWCDMNGNTTFKKWQKALNITAAISNGLYSIGNMYNSIKGVSGKEYIARNKAIENGKQSYGNLDKEHPNMRHKQGADFDKTRKTDILNENRARNNGQLRSDKTGKLLEAPQKSAKGVTPPANEAQIDHIFPKSKGGMNSYSNAQVIERLANSAKSNRLSFAESDYFLYSVPDKANIPGIIFSGINSFNSLQFGAQGGKKK